MNSDQLTNRIPSSLRPYFPEYDFTHLDPQEHAELVIAHVLAYGERQELRWLFVGYGRQKISDWV